jgi:hypothetical protein
MSYSASNVFVVKEKMGKGKRRYFPGPGKALKDTLSAASEFAISSHLRNGIG